MIRSVIAATVLCAVTVACGGDDPAPRGSAPPPSPTASPMTKAAYVAAVNKVCKDVLTASEGIVAETPEQYVAATKDYIKILEDGQARLRALEPPAEDRAKAQEFVAANEQQVQLLRDLLPTIEGQAARGDKAAVEAEFGKAFERFTAIADQQAPWANAYGLTECT